MPELAKAIIIVMITFLSSQSFAGSSSIPIYETLAKYGLENWREAGGGAIVLHSFSCNSTFLKDVKLQMHKCWYQTLVNGQVGKTAEINDETDATRLFSALKGTGLPAISSNDSSEDWSQIDADSLDCELRVDQTREPPLKTYGCSAVQKLKN